MLQNFHIKPGRIAMQLKHKDQHLSQLSQNKHFFQVHDKQILLIDSSFAFEPLQQKINIDLIIVSKNPKLNITQLTEVFNCKQYIFDASNSLWIIGKWGKECERLHLPFHSIPENGAFIVDL